MKFLVPAGTSRGVLTEKDSWFILLSDTNNEEIKGIGECSLIPGLSPDDIDNFEMKLNSICRQINRGEIPASTDLKQYPAIAFGLETAMLDIERGGKRILFPSDFTKGVSGIPINGLIWMGDKKSMLKQIAVKIDQGYTVLKMKVGAIHFDDELDLLRIVRSEYKLSDLELRVDANGAWTAAEAPGKLKRMSEYNIHSVEQPIAAGQHNEMAGICRNSPIDIALDEELIGILNKKEKEQILKMISPSYIIVKPSLLGGLRASEEWISIAEKHNIKWWVTSALESNIALNAIAQWTATKDISLPQGLGTGSLFSNNIPSPLQVSGEKIYYIPKQEWDISGIQQLLQ